MENFEIKFTAATRYRLFLNVEKEDIQGLLTDRLKKTKERLEEARESIKALCEAVDEPKNNIDYQHYFCGNTNDKEAAAKIIAGSARSIGINVVD